MPVARSFRIVVNVETVAPRLSILPEKSASRRRRRLSAEAAIKAFFGSNALVAIVVLALITIFLFREGFGFFGQNLANLRLYRRAGLEYVDIMRGQAQAHSALVRALNDVRVRGGGGTTVELDRFATQFSDAGEFLNALVSDAGDQALALREAIAMREGRGGDINRGENDEAPAAASPLNEEQSLAVLQANTAKFAQITLSMGERIRALLNAAPRLSDAKSQASFEKWEKRVRDYLAGLPGAAQRLHEWNPRVPVPWYRSVASFLFGKDWTTASFWQDWYGIIPLLVGSIMVASVALFIAVPFGVFSAIYVSEIAQRGEKSLIKPYIEFISAIPSVVLGFFGIAVVGQAVRTASHLSILHWVPFFPISERLNVFTAGCLLALMAVPTIFTLAEDALRNVPRGFKEASYALGANRLQTIVRILVPASLSGIISAILLGLGRVIGETMVVLLCAGNRIAIPDFTQGLGAFFQPVHTMTGIIAQEMGEVVRGSIHYRALFMVGLVLFVLTLGINYCAQKLVARYRMSIG
ncbi:MAG TPA: phosphate ABC transporter permease subunit PstC [Chthoniobacterales bacterium]|nr:phosphate ABC transporter permease subunit PstC [Chthoniobacterales bacterium]